MLGWRAVTSVAFVTLLTVCALRTSGFWVAQLRNVVSADEEKWKPIDFGTPPVEIKVIYIPEIPKEHERLEAQQKEFDKYIYGGRELMTPMPGADPDFWPGRGRLQEVKEACGLLESKDHWWDVVYSADPEVMGRGGLHHHVGCTGSHFLAWAHARQENAPGLIVSEVDGGMFAFERSTGGCRGDMMAIIRACWYRPPPGWEVFRFDMGTNGADSEVVDTLDVPGTTGKYHIFRWVAKGGEAGASFYMVSKLFLDRFPEILRKYKIQMVDSWLDGMCSLGKLRCFSVAAETRRPYYDCPDYHAADP